MKPPRAVFIISDHTGITAELIGKCLLSQFPGEDFAVRSLPFLDSPEKVAAAVERINRTWKESCLKPLVFSTLTDAVARAALEGSGAVVLDIFGPFLDRMIELLGRPATPLKGHAHGSVDEDAYHSRINAVNFALAADDGLSLKKYDRADLVLVGVSRSGKTPTSLYMAMHYGMQVANYPLTAEHFTDIRLPAGLRPHRDKLRGLTLSPERLSQIRAERRPSSHYAALETCRQELAAARAIMEGAGIPIIDSTSRSVEEIAALLRQSLPEA